MRLLVLAVLVLGCKVPPSKHRSAVGPEPKFSVQVRTWLEQVDLGVDCPMTIDEARGLRSIAGEREGDVAFVMGRVGCFCDVTTRYNAIVFDAACRFSPQPHHYHARSRDEARLLAWHNALSEKVRSGGTPEDLTRATPISKQLDKGKKKSRRGQTSSL